MNSDSTSKLLADLTEPQRQAVTTTEGPVLVLAAAGSGKTRVITRRAAFLILECGIPPWQVLSITFTNKAAGEMRQRVGQLVTDKQARALSVGTFHALCAKLLREHFEAAGVKRDYVIFDAADQKNAAKKALKDLDISTQHFTPAAVLSTISGAKNQLIDAETYTAQAGDFYAKQVARIYRRYQAILDASGALDFDDLLMKTAFLLKRDEPTREMLQDKYQYVQIDEYQDTNHAQFVIAYTLAAGHNNLCVVGDPDQSIYGWRGANIRNILEFETHFPGAQVIALGQNYRSTPEILLAADTLIQHNKQRRHKPLFTENPAGHKIAIKQAGDEEHEASLVVDTLRAHHEAGTPWSDMAVFYRVNALSRVMETKLLESSIPYHVARGTAFYQRKEIKDAVAYVRLIVNPDDEVSMLRVINTPTRGIGNTTIEHLQAFAAANGMTLWGAIQRAGNAGGLNARAVNAVNKFAKMITTWQNKIENIHAETLGFEPGMRDVIEMVLRDSGLEKFYKAEKTGDEEKLENLYELVTDATRFDDQYERENATLGDRVFDYLERIALVSDADAVDNGAGAVTLMTLHAAKGLEFPVVAMIGLEEGVLPHTRAADSEDELEEERRLCFVGITRAQQHLLMTHARYRTIRGLRDRTIPSPFIKQLGAEAVEYEDLSGYAPSPWSSDEDDDDFDSDRPGAFSEADDFGLRIGAVVRHPQFGLGRVMSLTPSNSPTRARVYFERAGAKTLVLEYARLELVDVSDF
ncbi:UvrD-helicase domain-containing protein [Planctomycetales bacterium ZRK34]|nr:UvrD-helicase domain-containing protein [Planctomycetales bacterium ZRK34]